MFRFALGIFISAFLLFQVQPLIARIILPWYGGTSMVWTVCLLFFQVGLLAGYCYAHLLSRLSRPRLQVAIHVLLLVAALATLPLAVESHLKPDNLNKPLASILFLLASTIGFTYLLISASGPLLQYWFKCSFPDRSPYRLYALSNAGSLSALLSYPFLVEPAMDLDTQASFWSFGFFVFALISLGCGWSACNTKNVNSVNHLSQSIRSRQISIADRILWILLPAAASILLLASTNQITQDIASVPFIWLIPLSLYLLSFILCFDRAAWYKRRFWIPLFFIALFSAIYTMVMAGDAGIIFQISVYSFLLFCGCMVCHGELVRIKPHPDMLTAFYLYIAFGGALGGIFVTLIAPVVFIGYWELHSALILIPLILGACLFRGQARGQFRSTIIKQAMWAVACGAIALLLIVQISMWDDDILFAQRNFYGVLRVEEDKPGDGSSAVSRRLLSGSTIHGSQITNDQKSRLIPTTYYGSESGIGIAIHEHPQYSRRTRADDSFRIGVVGMGVGTIAALCKHNDVLRFYEINPLVMEISQQYFSFLRDTQAEWKTVPGDARISLENEIKSKNKQAFDVLAIDAFSSDAIPVHLLTIESFQLYWQHLKSDGILAVHTSNRHLDLGTVVTLAALSLGKELIEITSVPNREYSTEKASWILMTNNQDFLSAPLVLEKTSQKKRMLRNIKVWTDNYSNLFEVIK